MKCCAARVRLRSDQRQLAQQLAAPRQRQLTEASRQLTSDTCQLDPCTCLAPAHLVGVVGSEVEPGAKGDRCPLPRRAGAKGESGCPYTGDEECMAFSSSTDPRVLASGGIRSMPGVQDWTARRSVPAPR